MSRVDFEARVGPDRGLEAEVRNRFRKGIEMELRVATRVGRSGSPWSIGLVCVLAALLAGCNLIDIALGRNAKIENMVPGNSVTTGRLDCWLTLNFVRLPSGIDPKDVRVRFESIALVEPAEFDWTYIADHDFLVPEGPRAFGSGHVKALHTTPEQPPELGKPIKARFPLEARPVIEDAPETIWLHATLY